VSENRNFGSSARQKFINQNKGKVPPTNLFAIYVKFSAVCLSLSLFHRRLFTSCSHTVSDEWVNFLLISFVIHASMAFILESILSRYPEKYTSCVLIHIYDQTGDNIPSSPFQTVIMVCNILN